MWRWNVQWNPNTQDFFTWQLKNNLIEASVLWRNDSRIHRNMKTVRDDRAVRLQWLMWPSTQRIGKGIRGSSQLFTRRVADVISEACFTAMTGDRYDELAALDLSMIAVPLTPSWLVGILTVIPLWLYFFLIRILFLNRKIHKLLEC